MNLNQWQKYPQLNKKNITGITAVIYGYPGHSHKDSKLIKEVEKNEHKLRFISPVHLRLIVGNNFI